MFDIDYIKMKFPFSFLVPFEFAEDQQICFQPLAKSQGR